MATSGRPVCVVVGFAEALSAPEVVWSLVDAGYRVMAFSRKGRRAALRHSRYATVHGITAPEDDWTAAVGDLTALLEATGGVTRARLVLLPLDDAALWLCDRMAGSAGSVLAGPQGDCAALALDKERQIETARVAGFDVPPTAVVSSPEELSPGLCRFPFVLRPADAVWRRGSRLCKGRLWICSDEVELSRARSAWNGEGRLLVQPFLEGTGEGVFGLATDNGIVAWSAHRRLRMMNPDGSGSSACVSRAVGDDVRAPAAAFVESSGWRGMFMIELLRTRDGRAWFVEFNGRAWGSMALARRQSLEYPAWTVMLALDRRAVPNGAPTAAEGVVCRNVGRELMHVLFMLRGSRSRAARRSRSVWDSVAGVCRIQRGTFLYNWRRDDWRVFVGDLWCTVRDQILKVN